MTRFPSLLIAAAVLASGAAVAQVQQPQPGEKASPQPTSPLTVTSGPSSATLYGVFDVDIENVRAGSIVSSRQRVNSNRSLFGIKGDTKLGIFAPWIQVESEVALDLGGTTLAGRNSGVGTAVSNFGTIMVGQWDSPYKFSTARLDPFGDKSIGAYSSIMGGGGLTTAGNGGGVKNSFARRVSNVIQYWSPNVAGFNFRAAYGTNKERPGDGSYNPQLFSFLLSFEQGPLYLVGAYEDHHDFGYLAPNQGHDQAWKLGAKFDLKSVGLTLGAAVEQLRYNLTAPSYELATFDLFLTGTYRLAEHALSLTYAQKFNDSVNGVTFSNTSANQLGFRYAYSLTKQADAYLFGVRLANGNRSAQDFSNNPLAGIPGGPSANPPQVPVGAPTPPVRAADLAGIPAVGFGTGLSFRF